MHAWQVFMEEFRHRAEGAASSQFERAELLGEAAHEAYRAAADRLTGEHGWEDEQTLVVMRGLTGVVQEWVAAGSTDWQSLAEEMRRREDAFERRGGGG